ncbi:MAG: diphthamide synthesis protein [archaeon]
MKTLFISAKLKSKINKSKILEISKKLPKNIAIAYSIQYINHAKEINDLLKKNHNVTRFLQVLGCSKPALPKSTQAILLIGDGKFHAISLAFESKLPVHLLSHNKLELISKKEIKTLEKKQKVAHLKFLHSDQVGILVSTKPGQQSLSKALKLKKSIKDKKSYLFLSNNINTSEFENFPQIQSWVNTACPRLDIEGEFVNMIKIKS